MSMRSLKTILGRTYEGRENKGLAPLGEAPDSVRGLARSQYPSRVNVKGCGGCLKFWIGTGRTVEMKRTPEDE